MSNTTKLFVSLIFICLGLGFIAGASAQEMSQEASASEAIEAINLDEDIKAEDLGIGEPRLLPDSPFYFLKNWGRSVRSLITFDPVKKAELKLKFSNERIIEAKKIAEKKPEIAAEAIKNYQKDLNEVKGLVEKSKLNIENPKMAGFLDKYTDRTIKQQKLLDRLEEKLPPEQYENLKKIKDETLAKFTEASSKIASPEKFQQKIEKIVQEQKGSRFKHIKNLEVLMRIEEKAPEKAKEAIRRAQANTLKRLQEDLNQIPEKEKPILKEYLKRISGNEVRHLDIISELEEKEIPIAVREMVENSKKETMERIEKKIKNLKTDKQKEDYLGHLKKGEIREIKVIKELENNLSPETVQKIIKIKTTAVDKFRKKIEKMETPEARQIFLKKIKETPNVKTLEVLEEIKEIVSPEAKEFFREIEQKHLQNLKEKIEEAKTEQERKIRMEALSSGSTEAVRILEKIELPTEVKANLKTIEAERIKRQIQRTDNPQKLEMLKQKIEAQKITPFLAPTLKILENKIERKVKEVKPREVETYIRNLEESTEIKEILKELPAEKKEILKDVKKELEAKNYQKAYRKALKAYPQISESFKGVKKTELIEKIKKEQAERIAPKTIERIKARKVRPRRETPATETPIKVERERLKEKIMQQRK